MESKIKKFLSDWRITLILLGAYAAALAAATFLEAAYDTAFAKKTVYHSWWFYLLHAAICANFIAVSRRLRLVKRKMWGILLLHYGFIIILIGALTTHVTGYEGVMHIREGEKSDTIVMGDNSVRKLPFSVELEEFTLVRYKWSHTPSSYESDVIITYNGELFPQKIYMNNIGRIAGFRIYQTSYDTDEKGTVLTVNNDRWGTPITYAGYCILFLGLILSVFRKGSRLRALYAATDERTAEAKKADKGSPSKKKRAVVTAAALFVLSLPFGAEAQPLRTVDRKHAQAFSEILIQAPTGRIEPISTYSSEIVRKIYHRDSYKGLNSDQVLAGMITDPEEWMGEPIIYISSKDVAKELGASENYVSFRWMFDIYGRYRISAVVDEIARKPPHERSKTDKEYLKLNEKVSILYAVFEGDMFAVFPVGDGEWLSPAGDTEGLDPKDSLVVAKTVEWYSEVVRARDYAEAEKILGIISKYQNAKTNGREVNPKKIRAEIFYNKADIFRWSFRLYLLLGFALAIIPFMPGAGKKTTGRIIISLIAAVFVMHTAGIGLRWYISGYAPWSNSYESMVHIGWTVALAGLLFSKRSYAAAGLCVLLGGVVMFVSNLNWLDPQITQLVPVLRSHWLMIHVSVITASYGLFGISAVCGIASLIGTIANRNLRELRAVNEMCMNIGLVLLTLGIFFGAVWANESWGRYWGWDPKETWALITMVVYAFVTHSRFVRKLNNPFAFDVMSIVAFGSVLMTFFGVNYYLSGLHSYGNSGEVSFSLLFISAGVLFLLFIAAWIKYSKNRDRLI